MTNATLFRNAHKVARSMKAADATLHYTLCFVEALRMVRESWAAEQANAAWLGYTVGDASLEACGNIIARNFNEIVEKRAKAEAFALRFKVKTTVRETERAVLAKCTVQDGTVEDQQWIPKSVIAEDGTVAEWFLNKNLAIFYSFI